MYILEKVNGTDLLLSMAHVIALQVKGKTINVLTAETGRVYMDFKNEGNAKRAFDLILQGLGERLIDVRSLQ